MSQPYVGEIRLVGFNFAPVGWAFCDGQLMSIAENDTLYNLIGTTYGGDGQNTFGLPNLQGRVPIHVGGSYVIGQEGGAEQITLTVDNMANHSHVVFTAASANSTSPVGHYPAVAANNVYISGAASTKFESAAIGPAGSGLPHENRQPFLALNYIISLFGVYPSQT